VWKDSQLNFCSLVKEVLPGIPQGNVTGSSHPKLFAGKEAAGSESKNQFVSCGKEIS
jgi:hypothetical protein